MKIAYFGTPEHSAYLLQKILDEGIEVVFVVTNPDKPRGRKKIPSPSPVKEVALKANLPVLQFPSMKLPQAIQAVQNYQADLFVVFAFGGILPEDIFEYPSGGSINLHGSLLPEYRGASPVQAALLDGKTETGYSIQYLARDVDSGDVITSEVIPILDNDNSETLLKRITEKGSEAILKLLKNPVNGRYPAKPQDHEKASHCKKIKPEDRKLDFSGSALSLHNRIRAFAPEKTCYFLFRNKRINIYESMLLSEKPEGLKTGELFCPDKKTLAITCGDGNLLSLIKIQPENKNPMQTLDFINGFKPQTGEKAL